MHNKLRKLKISQLSSHLEEPIIIIIQIKVDIYKFKKLDNKIKSWLFGNTTKINMLLKI